MSASDTSVHVASLEEVKSWSGLEFLRRIAERRVPPPPFAVTLGMDLAEVEPGRVVFTMTPQLRHYNPTGTVHGGVASTILDSCMSCAVQTHLAKGYGCTTLELKVNLSGRSRTRPGSFARRAGRCTWGAARARRRARSSTPRAPSSPTAPPPA